MRLLDEDNDRAFQSLLLLLTPSEASELKGALEALLTSDTPETHHEHVANRDYTSEITVSLYGNHEGRAFSERVKRLIAEGR